MNKEMLKELVKKHFSLTDNIETPEQTSEETFADATLVDGTKITNMVDADFEPGQTLHVITEGDVHIIAPEGSHVTDSGIEIVVDGEGVITEVNRPDQPTEEEAPAEEALEEEVEEVAMAEETLVEETELEEVVEEAMEEGDVKEAIVTAIAEVIAPQLEEMKAKLSEVEEKMKEYMSKPASEPTLQSKFNKIEQIKNNALKGEKSAFNSKKQQMEAIIKQNKKQN